MSLSRLLAAALLPLASVAALSGSPAIAQDYDRPPGVIDDQGGNGAAPPYQGATDSPDPAGLAVRLSRAENRLREMTGQIEELQNANRKLVDQLQKFQQDVESRLASGRSGRHAETSMPTAADVTPPVAGNVDAPAPSRKARRDDAYNPDAASPTDPGKPKPLGSSASAEPDDGGAPMDLSGGKLRSPDSANGTLAPTLRLPSAAPGPDPAIAPTSPRAVFDQALSLYKGKQYEDAEKGFTAFIQKNPKSRLAADATYYLGESFAQRGRSREAAEQYLKVSTDYSASTRAPDAMLHLGMSLKALGAKEQACATFTEVTRKYPNAPAYVKAGAEREAKRAQC